MGSVVLAIQSSVLAAKGATSSHHLCVFFWRADLSPSFLPEILSALYSDPVCITSQHLVPANVESSTVASYNDDGRGELSAIFLLRTLYCCSWHIFFNDTDERKMASLYICRTHRTIGSCIRLVKVQ